MQTLKSVITIAVVIVLLLMMMKADTCGLTIDSQANKAKIVIQGVSKTVLCCFGDILHRGIELILYNYH